jgi:hypothetical protein
MTSYLRYLRINLLTFSYVRRVSISTPLPIAVVVGYVILYDTVQLPGRCDLQCVV